MWRGGRFDECAVPQAPPSPQIARVLTLQRSAGNRQAADSVQRSWSASGRQRVDVAGTADWTSDPRVGASPG
jgi:hypothetical protein